MWISGSQRVEEIWIFGHNANQPGYTNYPRTHAAPVMSPHLPPSLVASHPNPLDRAINRQAGHPYLLYLVCSRFGTRLAALHILSTCTPRRRGPPSTKLHELGCRADRERVGIERATQDDSSKRISRKDTDGLIYCSSSRPSASWVPGCVSPRSATRCALVGPVRRGRSASGNRCGAAALLAGASRCEPGRVARGGNYYERVAEQRRSQPGWDARWGR
jgi:hypothetical protein